MKEHIRGVPLFADLSEEDLDRLCAGSELIELAPDEVLFNEGDDGDSAYVIIDGEVKIIKVTGEREVLLARRNPRRRDRRDGVARLCSPHGVGQIVFCEYQGCLHLQGTDG